MTVIVMTPVAGGYRYTLSVGATYDILPSGSTRAYWANDILEGSTLTGD